MVRAPRVRDAKHKCGRKQHTTRLPVSRWRGCAGWSHCNIKLLSHCKLARLQRGVKATRKSVGDVSAQFKMAAEESFFGDASRARTGLHHLHISRFST